MRARVLRSPALLALLVALPVACGDSSDEPAVAGDLPRRDAGAEAGTLTPIETEREGGGPDASAEGGAWRFRTRILTEAHRAIPGKMFGGWGPHLGHLVRTAGSLYWVDDACAAGSCDVNVDARIDYWKVDADAVTLLGSVNLPAGVQQNTATIASGNTLFSYGVDIAGHSLVECTFSPGSSTAPACAALGLDVGASANYVGAAIHPGGTRLVWLTNVGDGGGGSFRWFANYGGGWNGPRTGGIGGYNDASYINAGFLDRGAPGRFVLFAELVSGVAPSWTFSGGVGEGDLATTSAVTWSVAPSLADDPTITTSDLFVDPDHGDIHVLARSKAGALVYLHRPPGGAFAAGTKVESATILGRFLFAGGRLFVAHGPGGKGLVLREVDRGKGAIDFAAHAPIQVPLPPDFENVVGIYPEASTYQTTATGGINLAVVASAKENVALGVFATPP